MRPRGAGRALSRAIVNSTRLSAVVDPIAHARNEAAIPRSATTPQPPSPKASARSLTGDVLAAKSPPIAANPLTCATAASRYSAADTTAVQPIARGTVRSGIRASTPRVAADSNPTYAVRATRGPRRDRERRVVGGRQQHGGVDRPDPGEQGDEKADDEGDRRRLDDEGHAGGQADAAHEHEHEWRVASALRTPAATSGVSGSEGHTERSTSVELKAPPRSANIAIAPYPMIADAPAASPARTPRPRAVYV